MAEIIDLAAYKRQQARQLTATARTTLEIAHQELGDLRAHVEGRAERLLDMAAKLPDDSDLRIELERASGEFVDIAVLIGGGDPRECDREIAGMFAP